MNRLPKDKRDKLILVGLLTVLAVLGLWYGLISVQRNKIEEIGKKTAESEIKLARAKDLVKKREEIQTELQAVSAKLKAIETAMPSGDLYAWFIDLIDRFRAPYGVEIPQKAREEMVDVGVLPRFPYRAAKFMVKGSAYFHDFGRFLADFENTFPYIRVQNLDLEPATSSPTRSDDPEKLSFRMEIVAVTRVQSAAH